ncbi:hypothetical protein BC332_34423 [Capsicum chinense]|nr:hypothetical protein BC332_34423 [Capsicum chinense]
MEKEKDNEEEEEIDKQEAEKEVEGIEKEEVEEENGVAEETTTVGEEKQEAEKEKKVEEAPAAADAEKEGEQGENEAAAADVEKKGDKAEDGNKEAADKEEGEQKEEKEEAHQKDVVMDIIDEINNNICVDNIPHTLLIWRCSSSSDDYSNTMDLEWFADDGPIDAKPIASIEPKYDFEVKPVAEFKYDFEVKPIRSLDPKCDFEVKPINSVGPKCDFEAEPIELVGPKCDFGAKPIKSLDLKCFYLICIFKELIGLSLVYEAYEGRSISPWILVKNLSYFTSGFYKYEQEDAHEFLLCFLNRLESRFSGIVQQVFCIHLVSKLRCCNCGHYSNIYEPLIDVSLEIKDVDILHSVLESFTRVEKLDDPEIKFSCERCKVQVSIEKQLMLYNVPFVAIFHLKRLQNDGSVVRKVEKHVSFPLELDLLLYTDNNQTNNEQIKYDLYAVIVHVGSTSSSGHYYCFICAEPNEWYKFDDSMISRVHEDLVLAEKAYVMFYAKRDTLRFLDFVALQMHNVGTIPKHSFSLPNNHASDIVDNELKKTVQTSTPGPPSAINSSKEKNASQDVGVINRMAPLLPKSPSRSQSTLDQISSKNQWLMDPEQETEIMQPCSMIKKRVSGPRGEELIAALRILGSHGSSLNAKR